MRAALPLYDWVYRKQADTVFVNFNITIESLVSAFPPDAHFGYPMSFPNGGTDSAWLVRNSPRGNEIVKEMVDLQISMANVACALAGRAGRVVGAALPLCPILTQRRRAPAQCPAPGMGMIHTYVLHLLNGTVVNGEIVYYDGDCERMCAAEDIDVFNVRSPVCAVAAHAAIPASAASQPV